ncbi:STAS domain-containing protein [Bdellovibrio sp. SKB1291214]|uniref:STAS domain-containing protein n=1 Tax=Bdellovibrio sp. SKB1291214 TaxID=1732569 RepID=UPI000B5152FA|nr:STAS domain-containing protein [Bdellovibrio sp. SKB1291214]UYL07420.1 STAS domain-containing protein [Bdellovibrio sp. SKB1291214]
MMETKSALPIFIKKHEQHVLNSWTEEQVSKIGSKISVSELKRQCSDFMGLMTEALQTGTYENLKGNQWENVKRMLSEISRSRSLQGFSPSETAIFIFSLKKPLFNMLKMELEAQPLELANEMWNITTLLDQLGLFTTEAYQKTREEVIVRQQEEMLELSTPVVKLWDGILALPMIGTLDSSRTQVVMESLLQRIMETESEIAIIDITGVPTVDTLVAQHLMKTVTAARLMGAECIISGIRPQIAATIVHLGVDLGAITTKATLADAFLVALSRTNRFVTKGTKAKNTSATSFNSGVEARA